MKLLSTILLASLVLGASAQAEPELKNYIAAIVDDTIITFREVEDYTSQAVELLERAYGRQQEIFAKKFQETFSDGLEQLLEKQLILHDFKTSGGNLPDNFVDDEIKDRIRQRFGDRVTLTKTLQGQGITFETYRQRTHDEIIVNYMRQKNVSAALLISPQKIERFYNTNVTNFKLGDQVKLRMIVLNRSTGESTDDIKRLAREITTKIEEGASFAEMASIYSAGSQRQEGGDWGWVENSVLNKGLSEVAFSLKTGERSGIIGLARDGSEGYWVYQHDKAGQIVSGRKYTEKDAFVEEKKFDAQTVPVALPQEYYLMMVEDKRIARTKNMQEVKEEIEKTLVIQERARLHKKWIDRLRSKSFVRYF